MDYPPSTFERYVTVERSLNKENLPYKTALLTYKEGLLQYKQDLFTYTKKDLLKYKKPTANAHGKFLRQILATKSHDKFLWQISTVNSRKCNAEDGVGYSSAPLIM